MKRLFIGHTTPQPHHMALVRKHGTEDLYPNAPSAFWTGAPCFDALTRVEPGVLIKRRYNVEPHQDSWVGNFGARSPRFQRSIFWLLHGEVVVKVDGFKAEWLTKGNWMLFDHRQEHLVMACDTSTWLGAAWQVGRTVFSRGVTS